MCIVNNNLSDIVNIDIMSDKVKRGTHSFLVERENASSLTFCFSNINLPEGAYIEFEYGNKNIKREISHLHKNPVIKIPGPRVDIKIILPKEIHLTENFSLVLDTVEYENNVRMMTAENDRNLYMCLQGTGMAEYALASAAVRGNDAYTCILLGNSNLILTGRNTPYLTSGFLIKGEIWLNWFNQSCDPESPINEPVRLRLGDIKSKFYSEDDKAGFTFISLDDFDYLNSNVKILFGGLKLSEQDPVEGEAIYIPQYGENGLCPMYITHEHNDEPIKILEIPDYWSPIVYNSGEQAISSGSPIISRESNQLVGLQYISKNAVNIIMPAQYLHWTLNIIIHIEPTLMTWEDNISVIGLGKVSSFNFELTPTTTFDISIPIDLDQNGMIIPFDTVKIENYNDYSLIQVEAIDLITNEISPLTFKGSLVKDDYQTNINDNTINGNASLKIHSFDPEITRFLRCWLTFKVSDTRYNIRNYVIRFILSPYDLNDIPFDIENATLLDFNIDRNNKNSITHNICEYDRYGFIAFDGDVGPLSLVWAENGYSTVRSILKNSSGDDISVLFRGTRQTDCVTHSMNSAAACASQDIFSRLVLEYYPEDNENIIFENEIYQGIIALQAQYWGEEQDSINILVNVSLS